MKKYVAFIIGLLLIFINRFACTRPHIKTGYGIENA